MDISAKELQDARAFAGLSRAELADVLGVSLRTISYWESVGVPNHRVPLVLQHLAKYLEVPLPEREGPGGAVPGTPAGPKKGLGRATASWVHELEVERRNIRDSLARFSTSELLYEVGARVSDLEALAQIGRRDDPDYAIMSEEEAMNYRLAADMGDPNIGPEDLPEEP